MFFRQRSGTEKLVFKTQYQFSEMLRCCTTNCCRKNDLEDLQNVFHSRNAIAMIPMFSMAETKEESHLRSPEEKCAKNTFTDRFFRRFLKGRNGIIRKLKFKPSSLKKKLLELSRISKESWNDDPRCWSSSWDVVDIQRALRWQLRELARVSWEIAWISKESWDHWQKALGMSTWDCLQMIMNWDEDRWWTSEEAYKEFRDDNSDNMQRGEDLLLRKF